MKFKDYINERMMMGRNRFRGFADGHREIMMGQDDHGMHFAEVRDRHGDIESSTTKKTQQQIMKWFEEHGIKKIQWED